MAVQEAAGRTGRDLSMQSDGSGHSLSPRFRAKRRRSVSFFAFQMKKFQIPVDNGIGWYIIKPTYEQLFKCCCYDMSLHYPTIRRYKMKKTYKIDVDCANCANKMEEAARNTEGVKDAVVNFMTLKMKVEFEDEADPQDVMQEVLKNCKKVESDCEIYL